MHSLIGGYWGSFICHWINVWFNFSTTLLLFRLPDLTVAERSMLKSAVIADL